MMMFNSGSSRNRSSILEKNPTYLLAVAAMGGYDEVHFFSVGCLKCINY